MLLGHLRKEVCEANLELVRRGLVLYTFGNASAIDRDKGLIVIKPSGVPYDELKPEDLVVTDLSAQTIEGNLRPSSDLLTHLILYSHFPGAGGIAHTHSEFATAWAQAGRAIPCLGTTHADYFHGSVPVTSDLTAQEIDDDYEKNTGLAICKAFHGLDPMSTPAVLVRGHAPFCWGKNVAEAAHNAVILEAVARMAYYTTVLEKDAGPLASALHDKHFFRKHGSKAYYGQAGHKTS
jgi:L-ribulose-5-phosphate 4-epimerase